ncbi:MAG: AAA family ATPase [Prevotellaceae bacterium]|jgi:MoxR-like ATPase|nr:AAA family ATPase [Prevotellaceae bacterium]
MTVKQKIKDLLEKLNEGVYEKENEIALSLLSAVAGESIFMLGAPGVAKSLIARRLKYAFKDGKSFEYLMSRFSTPDEIFGPVSIKKLKEDDKYERVVENYLPAADVVFLDEIWKAGSSIQNALLTVINEKIYRNGDTEIKVPLKALISASNELPTKNEGLEALWDRFLVRLVVEGVKGTKKFNDMISKSINNDLSEMDDSLKISKEEYELWSKEIEQIEVPENVFNVIDVIRKKLQEHNNHDNNKDNPIYISDRRWRKIIRLLRTSAFLNDRTAIDLMDCFLIKECIWNEEGQIATVKQFVSDVIKTHGYKLQFDFNSLKDDLAEFVEEIEEETKFVKDLRVEVLVNARSDYYEIDWHNNNANLIRQTDFNSLTNSNKKVQLYSYDEVLPYFNNWNIRKSDSKFSIFINDKEYQLKTTINSEKRQMTKKPHKILEESWDKKVQQYLDVTNQQKEELNLYRTKDLEHLRTNTFVNNPALANIVESRLTTTQKQIEKYELDIRKIQYNYKKLKNKIV